MRTLRVAVGGGAAIGLAFLLASGASAQPAQYSPQDVIKAFSAPADTPAPAAGGKDHGGCPAGTVLGDQGECDPTVETRGFSLADPGGSAPIHKAAALSRAPRHAVAAHRPVRLASAAVSPGDLLINFQTGSSVLTGQGRANAKVFAAALNSPALLGARFEISGHTDSTGSPVRNQALSQARAAAVRSELVSDGVDAGRVVAKGYGAEQPVAGLNPGAAANRRVEARKLDVNS